MTNPLVVKMDAMYLDNNFNRDIHQFTKDNEPVLFQNRLRPVFATDELALICSGFGCYHKARFTRSGRESEMAQGSTIRQ